MNALERVRFKKQTVQLDICELKRRLSELFQQYKYLDEQETELYEDFFGTTKCAPHNFNEKKNKAKNKTRRNTSTITEKFKTLSREEQANLLQLLTMGDDNDK